MNISKINKQAKIMLACLMSCAVVGGISPSLPKECCRMPTDLSVG